MSQVLRFGKTGAVGRADLLDYLRLGYADGLAGVAGLLGYEEKPPQDYLTVSDKRRCITSSVSNLSSEGAFVPVAERPKAPFWLVDKAEFLNAEDRQPPSWLWEGAVLDPEHGGQPPLPVSPRDRPELARWECLWPFLRAALGDFAAGAEVDWRRVVHDLARRGTMPRRLPTRPRRRWAGKSQLILDYDARLPLFWPDLNRLRKRLERLRGRNGLEVCCFVDGLGGMCRSRPDADYERPYRLPQPGTPVLAVGDLGLLNQSNGGLSAWLGLGQRLRRGGCRPTALLPVSSHRWPEPLANGWRLAVWDRRGRFPRLDSSLAAGGRPTEQPGVATALPTLLALLSPAVCVDSDLLRNLRMLVPGAGVDCEAAAWLHDKALGGLREFWFESSFLAELREQFRQLGKPLREQAARLILANHLRHPEPVCREVEGVLASLLGDDATESEAYFRCVARLLADKKTNHQGWLAWARRFSERQHPTRWRESEALPVIWALAHRDRPEGEALRPPLGLDVSRVAWLLSSESETHDWRLVQRGEQVVLVTAGDLTGPGSHLGELTTTRALLTVEIPRTKLEPRLLEATADVSVSTLPVEGGLTIVSDHQRLHLCQLVMPSWAKVIGRDGAGLYVEVGKWGENRRLYWQPPARHQVEGGGLLELTKGFWLDADLFAQWPKLLRRPDWADDFGVDQYGLFAAFVYRGVRQVLRWIAPGRFMMGSPEDEQGRKDDEVLREITISKGFWLADTACSQELWLTVMENNPSYFKGNRLPVENLNWLDTVDFIGQLNSSRGHLSLRLPSEAEWEWACRAGTTTPFSFGANITPEQVNYDGNYPYADGEKGLFREKMVAVGSLPANNWGLYEMHGNVWEWCSDGFEEYYYSDRQVLDPLGYASDGRRVMRGGGWTDNGSNVRSANRSGNGPTLRGRSVGFRLARSQ